jgi:hypothetical protein
MAFINNKKMIEIMEAARNGNEKALIILQAMKKGNSQEDVDGLVNDYYNIVNDVPPIDLIEESSSIQPEMEVEEMSQPTDAEDIDDPQMEVDATLQPEMPEVVDLSELLGSEMEGLLDENDIEELSFNDFLGNKRRDGLRARKNADYFKAFDLEGRNNYAGNKIAEYGKKFDGHRRNIEREHSDLTNSIDNQINGVNLLLDDNVELNMDTANQAYDDLTQNEGAMSAMSRYWDETDNIGLKETLQELVIKYGKKNIMAVLNTLKSDIDNYKNFKNNQIDEEVNRYTKSIEKLLK